MNAQSPVQKRTVQHIIQVTYDLLNTHYFDMLTVQQLCAEAEINRSTFYRYFEDKYDLLYHLAQFIGQEFEKRKLRHNDETSLNSFAAYFEENKAIFKHVLSSERSVEVLNQLKRIHSKILREEARTDDDVLAQKIRESSQPEMFCDFISSGLIEILRNWTENKYEEDTKTLFKFLNEILHTL